MPVTKVQTFAITLECDTTDLAALVQELHAFGVIKNMTLTGVATHVTPDLKEANNARR